MLMLELFEIVLVILYMALMITEVFIPLANATPLFPSFRKSDETIKQTKKGVK